MFYKVLAFFQIVKEKSTTGNGDKLGEPIDMKVQGSCQMYDLLFELDSHLHAQGSALTPKIARDESGVVYKRPAAEHTITEGNQQPSKKHAPMSKPNASTNFSRMCDLQSDCLESLVNEQMKTNDTLTLISEMEL